METTKKILGNSSWSIAEKIITMIVSVFVTGIVARYYGAADFGLYSFAMAYVMLFSALPRLGMDTVIVKDIAQKVYDLDVIINNAVVMRFLATIITILIINLSAWFVIDDNPTQLLIAVLSGMMIFQVSGVIDLYNQSQLKSKYTAFSYTLGVFSGSAFRLGAVIGRFSLYVLAVTNVLQSCVTAVLLLYYYTKRSSRQIKLQYSKFYVRSVMKESWPLLLSGVAITVYMQVDQVMLGMKLNSTDVAYYSAAVRISTIAVFFPASLMNSFRPLISKMKLENEKRYLELIEKALSFMLVLSFGMCIVSSFLSEAVVVLIFGDAFIETASILNIHIWSVPIISLGFAANTWLVIEKLTKTSLIITLIGAIVNIILNLYLIPRYKGVGAAYATLISQAVSTSICLAVIPSTRKIVAVQVRAIIRLPIFVFEIIKGLK